MAELKITLRRNVIGRPQSQHTTVKALGSDKVNSIITKPTDEAVKGMVSTISYLVDVEEI